MLRRERFGFDGSRWLICWRPFASERLATGKSGPKFDPVRTDSVPVGLPAAW